MTPGKRALMVALIFGGLAGCATETGNGGSTTGSTSTSGTAASTTGASTSASSGSSGTTGSSGTSGDGGYVCVEAGVSPESNCGEGCRCCANQCVCTPGSACPDAGP